MNSLQFPPFLQPGDSVILLSPSGKIDHSFLKGAKKRLKSWGLDVTTAPHAGTASGWYAGSIRQRWSDLQNALNNDKAKAILCSRGGYGAVHLVDKLDFTRFCEHPKWLIGFSDITALHNVVQRHGFASLHAPMARHLTVEPDDDRSASTLKELLFGTLPDYLLPSHKLNRKGSATGILRGGNLSVLQGLRGTPYDFPAEETILFLEDVGERPHSIERMMYNLKLGGVLEKLSGLIIGQFTEYEENLSLGKKLCEALADVVKEYAYPVCFDFPVGHTSRNEPLICGAEVKLEVGSKEVKLHFNNPINNPKDETELSPTSFVRRVAAGRGVRQQNQKFHCRRGRNEGRSRRASV
jgi:muramoyltetrapeptide carboxypeptidase